MKSASSELPVTVRVATPQDLDEIARIQAASPEASQWPPADYLDYQCLIAASNAKILAGFIVFRPIAEGESELLNLAVDPAYRRHGVGVRLVNAMLAAVKGTVFLEVRESNKVARKFYTSMGFDEIGVRPDYYQNRVESGIVMKFLSC
jgi:ribosomal-protein-alanine N-acetyltransferase